MSRGNAASLVLGGSSGLQIIGIRADIRRIAAIKDGDVVTGNRTKVKIVKNKMAPPFREAEFDIIYGEGISKEGDLIDLGVAQNLVEKSGAWYSYKGERIGQGRENARQFLKDNPEVFKKLDVELRKALGLTRAETAAVPPPVQHQHGCPQRGFDEAPTGQPSAVRLPPTAR